VCSSEILVLRPKTGHLLTVLGAIAEPHFFERLVSHADGTRMPRARTMDVLGSQVKPSSDESVEGLTNSLVQLATAANRESEVLVRLRDVLLPKLISGELRITDARRFVEEAV
jgi:type I restriction enzyme S subunit